MSKNIPKQTTIEELCKLSTQVMVHLEYKLPADCFCHKKEVAISTFSFSVEILEFIQEAVQTKIDKESKPQLNALELEKQAIKYLLSL